MVFLLLLLLLSSCDFDGKGINTLILPLLLHGGVILIIPFDIV